MTLRVVARIDSKPDKVAEVCELLTSLVEPTRKEPGCISYELLQNKKSPTDFTFVEEWDNEAALEAHSLSDHIRAVGPKLRPLTTAAPDIRLYTMIR